jgi:hypothetical protein
MPTPSPGTARRLLALLPLLLAAVPSAACAQAWLPEVGDASVSVIYNDTLNKKHYLPNGDEIDVGHTRTQTIGLAVGWAPAERWWLQASVPYVQTRYYGPAPHPTEVDDGDEHRAFTDLRVAAHFQWLEGPVAVAPFVAVVTPIADYETLGHAAPGRGLDEFALGFYAGAALDDWLPRTWLQVHYDRAFVERVAGIHHDRSRADVEFGWFATRGFSISASLQWQETHGGIPVPVPRTSPLFPYHDQLADDDFLNAGASVSWFPTPTISLTLGYATSLHGQNGHKLDHGVTLAAGFRR